jgi:hypothetical protein
MVQRPGGSRAVILIVAIVCSLVIPAAAQNEKREFPREGGTEYEHSIITIPIYSDGNKDPEVLKLDAYMRLIRGAPIRNGIGYRQFEFVIDSWELHGYSKTLKGNITFSVSKLENEVSPPNLDGRRLRPKSLGVAMQKDSDFPAVIVYNAIYDIFLDNVALAVNQPGVAFATNVQQIPPRNTSVAFEKPFDSRNIKSKSAVARVKGLPRFNFAAGMCEDMESITEAQWKAGVAKTLAIRSGKKN